MNAFLKAVMARRDAEHERDILAMRGEELPRYQPTCDAANAAKDALHYERRKRVAELRAQGKPVSTIAGLLSLSVKQVRHAMEKQP